MKIKFILGAMLVVGAVSYSAEATDAVAQEVINEVRNIKRRKSKLKKVYQGRDYPKSLVNICG